MQRNRAIFTVAALALTAMLCGNANAQNQIGVNFVGGYDADDDPDLGVLGETFVTGTAGVPEVAQGNWNNLGAFTGDGSNGTAMNLNDASGAATTADITWAVDGTWASTPEIDPADEDRALMNGYLDATSTTTPSTFSFSEIPYAAYDVYVYVGSDGDNRTGRVRANGAGATFFQTDSLNFIDAGDYFRATAATEATAQPANYIRYDDISGASLEIDVQRLSNNTGIHGIQIVEELNPNPLTATINRDTGEVIVNSPNPVTDVIGWTFSSAVGNLDPAAWDKVTGNKDANGDGSFDPDDVWEVTSETANLLSETEGFGNGGTLTTFNAGNIWRQWYEEDLAIAFDRLVGFDVESTVITNISYTGNNDQPFLLGDTNFDGSVDATDWQNQKANYKGDLSGAADMVESYGMGDFDGDLDNDLNDVLAFKTAYEAANGAGSAAALGAVPEPSTIGLLAIAGLALFRRRALQFARAAAAMLTVFALLASQPAFAQFGIGINFGAMDNGADLSVTGPAGAFDNENWNNIVGAASTEPVPLIDNLGGATNATVEWDSPNTWSSDGDTSGRGEDNHDGDGADGGTGSLMNGYIDSTDDPTDVGDSVVMVSGLDSVITTPAYDVYVYVNGGVGGRGGTYTIGDLSQFKTVPADMPFGGTTADLIQHEEDDMGMVIVEGNYMKFSAIVGDSFELRGNADADGFRAGINGVEILETGALPQVLRARVDVDSGTIGLVNTLGSAFTIDYFELTSPSGALDSANWSPLGSGTDDGSDWETLVETDEELSQFFLQGDSTLAANGGTIVLGQAWDGSEMDLNFRFHTVGGGTRNGIVEFGDFDFAGGGDDDADFDGNGQVDGADELILQRNFGTGTTLAQGDANGDGAVDGADQAIWNTQFGSVAAAGAAAAVPEPTTAGLLLTVAAAAFAARRRFAA